MSINTLLTNTTILDQLVTKLIPDLPTLKIATFSSQFNTSGNSITVQNQTITVTPNSPIYLAISFSYSLTSAGTDTATLSNSVNGGTAQSFNFPTSYTLSSNFLQSQTVYLTFTPSTSSANIVSTLSSTVSLTGSGITSMIVFYK